MYIDLNQRWACVLLHIAAKTIAGLIAQNGLAGLGWLAYRRGGTKPTT